MVRNVGNVVKTLVGNQSAQDPSHHRMTEKRKLDNQFLIVDDIQENIPLFVCLHFLDLEKKDTYMYANDSMRLFVSME